MSYRRRILRLGPSPTELIDALDERAVVGCWFELRRLGGCGRGEIRVRDRFVDRDAIAVGQWIACEFEDGDRWYLGQIQERSAASPAEIVLRLNGMSAHLDGVFPGGFGGDGALPHRYAATDRFAEDPDHSLETVDIVDRPEALVRLLMHQYVSTATEIQVIDEWIEDAPTGAELLSLKFHGEESVRSILKDLGLRVGNATWGVDERGRFFFRQPRTDVLATYQEGVHLSHLVETQDRDLLFNRVLLTGGYFYEPSANMGSPPQPRRWRGSYRQPESIAQFGERRISLWIPWIRTPEDSRQFLRAFFQRYASPPRRVEVSAPDQRLCPRPWDGRVRIRDRQGVTLIESAAQVVRVQFDHAPRLTLTIGPEDPRELWPAPPNEDRFPLLSGPDSAGGPVTFADSSSTTDSSSSGGMTDAGCALCEAVPLAYRVIVNAVADGSCECSVFNGVHVLQIAPPDPHCHWKQALGPCGLCGDALIHVILTDAHGELRFLIGDNEAAFYQSTAAWNCLGTNPFERVATNSQCTGWPAELTLEPV